MAFRLQEVRGQHRGDHTRNREAHENRNHHGNAEVLEELARNARHQADRQEHRDDTERRRHNGQTDFIGGIDRRLIGRFAHPHMAHDILDLHDRIIDQNARDKSQREQ